VLWYMLSRVRSRTGVSPCLPGSNGRGVATAELYILHALVLMNNIWTNSDVLLSWHMQLGCEDTQGPEWCCTCCVGPLCSRCQALYISSLCVGVYQCVVETTH
jgi:hypothetical protein